MNKNIIIVVLMIIIILMGYFICQGKKQLAEQVNLTNAAYAEMETFVNANGELVAKIESFETEKTATFLTLKTKDEQIQKLQQTVKRYKRQLKNQGSVTNFSTEGGAVTVTETEVIIIGEDPPIYKSEVDLEGWITGTVEARADSTELDIKYRDEYALVVGVEPTGFLGLGKGRPFGQVTSSNPYNEVKTLRTYQVKTPIPKKFAVGPIAGVSLGLEDSSVKITPIVGVGIMYSLIRF